MLSKDAVIDKIKSRLDGVIGDGELVEWAKERHEEDLSGGSVFEVRHRQTLYEAIIKIIAMEGG